MNQFNTHYQGGEGRTWPPASTTCQVAEAEAKAAGVKACVYCGLPLEPVEVHNSLSRWLKDTYICNPCGEFEAGIDLGRFSRHEVHKLAFTAIHDGSIGLAVEGQRGYYPLKHPPFESYALACTFANGLNRLAGLDERAALVIVCSSLFKR